MRRTQLAMLFGAAAFAVFGTSTLYARDADTSSGSMMGRGMMSGGMMGGGHMMGMSRMTGHCGEMMQSNRGDGRPNEQWRDGPPAAPEDN